MSKDSKKRNDLINKIGKVIKNVKARLPHSSISDLEEMAKLSEDDIFLQRVAINKDIKEGPRRLELRFDYLYMDVCVFEQVDGGKLKSLLEKFKKFTSLTLSEFPSSRLARDEVTNTGSYCSLFRYLSPDIERLKETELSPGRIFYFIHEPENCVQIVSIETKHRSND